MQCIYFIYNDERPLVAAFSRLVIAFYESES